MCYKSSCIFTLGDTSRLFIYTLPSILLVSFLLSCLRTFCQFTCIDSILFERPSFLWWCYSSVLSVSLIEYFLSFSSVMGKDFCQMNAGNITVALVTYYRAPHPLFWISLRVFARIETWASFLLENHLKTQENWKRLNSIFVVLEII